LLSEVARLQIAYEAVDERNAKEGVEGASFTESE
jgi:hypothetical protein